MARSSGVVWTKEMDDELMRRRVTQRLPWRSVAPIGPANAKKCQDRLKLLQSRTGAIAPANEHPEPADRDGLVWLRQHKRLSGAQAQIGLAYRELFRHVVDMGGAPLGSNLEALLAGGGGSGGGAIGPGGGVYVAAAARAELFRVRWIVLGGQIDLHTVMDGVCGLAHTVRYLAGGNQVRAAQLEAALRIALDLLIADARPKLAKTG